MRIVYVSHTHPPEEAIMENNVGGMQRVSQQLIRELERKESVFLEKETANVNGKGQVGLKALFFLIKLLVKLPQKVRESNADVVLFSSMVTASMAWFLRGRIDVPMVTINHGRDVTLPVGIYQWFVPKVFASLDGVISVSGATREECIKRGMEPEKGIALPNGFDLNKLKNFPGKEESRESLSEQFHIPLKGKKMLLTVGRQVKRKGHEWFIKNVLPKLEGEVIYVAVGDGPEFENISKAAGESPLRDSIFLLGRQPDSVLKKAYAAADLFVMPNIPVEGDMEGFGIVMLEANMAKTPAVASDLEGIKDVIQQGENGFRVEPLDADMFAHKINSTLAGELDSLSEQTRIYVQQQFNWEKVAADYMDYLRKVIRQSKS